MTDGSGRAGRVVGRVADTLSGLALVAGALATLAGFLGAWSWALDLFSHFRVQYALLLLGVAVVGALRRRRWIAWPALGVALIDLAAVAPLYLGGAAAARAAPSGDVRILVANVLTANRDFAALDALIRRYDPDVVGLLEVDRAWLKALAPTFAGWPAPIVETRPDNFGVALFARAPLRGRVVHHGRWDVPTVVARFETAGGPLTVVLAHPPPPVGAEMAAVHATVLEALGDARPRWGPRVVVMGDLNTTPWSARYRRFVEAAGLRSVREGFGVIPTWPTGLSVLAIPIDHVLVAGDLVPRRVERGPDIGSDHYPLLVDLAISPSETPDRRGTAHATDLPPDPPAKEASWPRPPEIDDP